MDYRQRITNDPAIRSGKPIIRGTRITVADVLEFLASGMSVQEVLSNFPNITEDDVQACLARAAESCR